MNNTYLENNYNMLGRRYLKVMHYMNGLKEVVSGENKFYESKVDGTFKKLARESGMFDFNLRNEVFEILNQAAEQTDMNPNSKNNEWLLKSERSLEKAEYKVKKLTQLIGKDKKFEDSVSEIEGNVESIKPDMNTTYEISEYAAGDESVIVINAITSLLRSDSVLKPVLVDSVISSNENNKWLKVSSVENFLYQLEDLSEFNEALHKKIKNMIPVFEKVEGKPLEYDGDSIINPHIEEAAFMCIENRKQLEDKFKKLGFSVDDDKVNQLLKSLTIEIEEDDVKAIVNIDNTVEEEKENINEAVGSIIEMNLETNLEIAKHNTLIENNEFLKEATDTFGIMVKKPYKSVATEDLEMLESVLPKVLECEELNESFLELAAAYIKPMEDKVNQLIELHDDLYEYIDLSFIGQKVPDFGDELATKAFMSDVEERYSNKEILPN